MGKLAVSHARKVSQQILYSLSSVVLHALHATNNSNKLPARYCSCQAEGIKHQFIPCCMFLFCFPLLHLLVRHFFIRYGNCVIWGWYLTYHWIFNANKNFSVKKLESSKPICSQTAFPPWHEPPLGTAHLIDMVALAAVVKWKIVVRVDRVFKPLFCWGVPMPMVGNCLVLLFPRSQLYFWIHHFWWDFCACNHFQSNLFRLRGWCILGVFLLLAFTHLGHKCQDLLSPCSGKHVCTDQTLVYTLIWKSFGGMESESILNLRKEIPSTRGSEEGRICDAASHRTASATHYQLSYFGPCLVHVQKFVQGA